MPLAVALTDVFLAVGALLSGTAGFLAAWAALRKMRNSTALKAEEDCLGRLRAAREEAEAIAKSRHDERMERLG